MKPTPEIKRLLSVRQLAEHLSCTRAHIYDLIADNRLKYVNIGKSKALYATYRFDPDDLWKEKPKLGDAK